MSIDVLIFTNEAPAYAAALARELPELTVQAATSPETAVAAGRDAEIIVALAHEITAELIAAMPKLRWIQALTTGTDSLMTQPNLPPDVVITSGRGIHGPQISEMAFLHMIALSRNFPRMLANQKLAVWERWPQRLLLGKTAVVVGVGVISEELAVRCKAFGMRVVGISAGRSAAPGFDVVLPRDRLKEAAGEADFLIILVPLAPDTHHLVNRDIIAALPPQAILINLARGDVVDEAALIDALTARRIAGAGLDVFSIEPLPAESPLWHLDNVTITPRLGGMSDVYRQQIMPVLLDNMRAYVSGDRSRLRNIVRA